MADLGYDPRRAAAGGLHAERPGAIVLHIPRTLLPILALGAGLAVTGLVQLVGHQRALEAELRRVDGSRLSTNSREQELESTIARQHQALTKAESDMEALRFRVESVEMQLDGVDTLSRQIRQTMGLPPSAGTWNTPTITAGATAIPQGGAYAPGASVDQARLSLVQQRLASGMTELYGLLGAAKQNAEAKVMAPSRPPVRDVPRDWPAVGSITSDFGWRIFRGLPNYHSGIDIAVDYNTPLHATADGVVVGSGWQPGYGLCVLLQHGGGYNTLYAHMAESAVNLGEVVKPGSLLGWSGSSGNSTGPHVHYEVWQNGNPVDPWPYMGNQ